MHVSVLKLLKYSYDGVLAGNCQYRQQWAWRWNFLETGEEPTTNIFLIFFLFFWIFLLFCIHLYCLEKCVVPVPGEVCIAYWQSDLYLWLDVVWSVPVLWDLIPGWHWGCSGLYWQWQPDNKTNINTILIQN